MESKQLALRSSIKSKQLRLLLLSVAFNFSLGLFADTSPGKKESNTIVDDVYVVQWNLDLPLMAFTGFSWIGSQLFLDRMIDQTCPCDKNQVNHFDRPYAGSYDKKSAQLSDIGVSALIMVPFIADFGDLHGSENSFSRYLNDATVLAQTILFSGFINQSAKLAFRRPRPLLYREGVSESDLQNRDNYLSFYSAHTSNTFAGLIAYSKTFSLRHPNSPWTPYVYGGSVLSGLSIAYLRVRSGKHYPTDVIAGAVMGTAIGILIPEIHLPHKDHVTVTANYIEDRPVLTITKYF